MAVEFQTNVASVSAAVPSVKSAAQKGTEKVTQKEAASSGVVYEKAAQEDTAKKPYSIHRMSETDRAALVQHLKAEQETRQNQLTELVSKMLSGQAKSFAIANGEDQLWKFLAKGDFTVDEETRRKAQEEISEDGYWGVKQTSQRLFDFASALAGDDVDKMKKMQAAMQKGFDQAAKTWGQELPGISHDTMAAANQLFEDYYASKRDVVTEG